MREYIVKITDGGNAHLQAFVRPTRLINASKPFCPFQLLPTQQPSWYHVFFVCVFSSELQNSDVPSLQCTFLTRTTAIHALFKAPALTYEHSMAQYRAMRTLVGTHTEP